LKNVYIKALTKERRTVMKKIISSVLLVAMLISAVLIAIPVGIIYLVAWNVLFV
jgi:hypothetical protein